MITYRASELGRCLAASVAERLGHEALPPPAWLQTIFDGGIAHEEECIAALQERGWKVVDQQLEVVLQVTPDIQVVGHLDGKCADHHPPTQVLEVKSPGAYDVFERAVKTADYTQPLAFRYAWQISCYMLATGLEAMVACLKDDQLRLFGIEVPPYTLGQIKVRINEIEKWARRGELPDCTSDDAGCPFRNLDGRKCSRIPVTFDPVLDILVSDYEALRAKSKEMSEAVAAQRQQIFEHLGERDSVVTDEFKVTRFTTKETDVAFTRKASTGLRITGIEEK